STASALTRTRLPAPTLVLHGHDDASASAGDAAFADVAFARILAVVDEDGDTEATTAAAAELARLTGGAVTLALVHDPDRDRKATLLPTAVLAPAAHDA